MALATLGRMIGAGEVPPLSILPVEADLASRLGVGRSVVREAVKVLSAKGLLSARPRHGTQVRPVSEWNLLDPQVLGWLVGPEEPDPALLRDLIEMRWIVEPQAAELAAGRAGPEDCDAIRAAYRAMQEAMDPEAAIEADRRFHLCILAATHNDVLGGLRGVIDAVLLANFHIAIRQPGAFRENLAAHGKVADAIEDGDGAEARAAMLNVLATNRAHIEAYLAGRALADAKATADTQKPGGDPS